MKITQLYVYPIKSIRGIPVTTATVTKTGFAHDRQFMLLKVEKDEAGQESLKNMHVPHFPPMCLFTTAFRSSGSSTEPDQVVVTYTPSADPDPAWPQDVRTLEVPLRPETKDLDILQVNMHSSPTPAFRMPSSYSAWFSECFGFAVVLAYLGPNSRAVLGSLAPKPNVVKQGVGYMSTLLSAVGWGEAKPDEASISFADCANYLVVTEESLADASDRLPGEEEMDVTKFRPNIVVSGAAKAWDEDFWASVAVRNTAGGDSEDAENAGSDGVEIVFTSNCLRCASINVDYETGKMGTGESGQMLKKLQKDRRVDLGGRFSPVFGRYGYLGRGLGVKLAVGAQVVVDKRNEGHSKFDWPGVAGIPPLATKVL